MAKKISFVKFLSNYLNIIINVMILYEKVEMLYEI